MTASRLPLALFSIFSDDSSALSSNSPISARSGSGHSITVTWFASSGGISPSGEIAQLAQHGRAGWAFQPRRQVAHDPDAPIAAAFGAISDRVECSSGVGRADVAKQFAVDLGDALGNVPSAGQEVDASGSFEQVRLDACFLLGLHPKDAVACAQRGSNLRRLDLTLCTFLRGIHGSSPM